MVALHLIPTHRAIALKFHHLGEGGQYSIVPLYLDDGRWYTASDPALVPAREAESAENGGTLNAGELELSFKDGQVTIRNKGLAFGKCNLSGYLRSLEDARREAAPKATPRVTAAYL